MKAAAKTPKTARKGLSTPTRTVHAEALPPTGGDAEVADSGAGTRLDGHDAVQGAQRLLTGAPAQDINGTGKEPITGNMLAKRKESFAVDWKELQPQEGKTLSDCFNSFKQFSLAMFGDAVPSDKADRKDREMAWSHFRTDYAAARSVRVTIAGKEMPIVRFGKASLKSDKMGIPSDWKQGLTIGGRIPQEFIDAHLDTIKRAKDTAGELQSAAMSYIESGCQLPEKPQP